MATVDELDGLLASLNQLKAPGASKTKITAITTLCVNNIQIESSIVQSFYRALKKAPPTHKLGALYVIDSVVRQWIEKAKAAGQALNIGGRGEPGTYPAAVKRVTELMPALLDDMVKEMPAEQKPKLENILQIWERGNTFPANVLADTRSKMSAAQAQPAHTNGASHVSKVQVAPKPTRPIGTPLGYPSQHIHAQDVAPPARQGGANIPPPPAPKPAADVNSILAALSKNIPPAPTPSYQTPAPAPSQPPAPPGHPAAAQLPPGLAAFFSQQAAQSAQPGQQQFQQPPPPPFNYAPPASAPPAPTAVYPAQPQYNGYPPQPPPSIPQAYPAAPPPHQQPFPPASQSDPLAQLRGLLPENILNDQAKLIPALQLLQDLQKGGIPADQWAPVLKSFEEQIQPSQPAGYGQIQGRHQGRSRSRSPDRNGRVGGRGSPVYGAYDADKARRDAENDPNARGGRNRYRQRSPMRQHHDNPDAVAMNGKPMQPKIIGFDPALPPGNIKVLSRTLFVGGANGTQQEIQDVFERYGKVQTCIANRDKRHAFVKMTTRDFALNAKAAMEDLQNRNDREVMNVARQTKWGVGFGPRECCDYAKGESVIPIEKLTDADTKWLLTAEFGGTGGRAIEGGMVLEEPDIEIGAGVSSKAMSKRVGPDAGSQKRQNDRGGRHGGNHHKNKGHDRDYGYQQGYGAGGAAGQPPMDPYGYARPEPVAVATPPAVPGFGFTLGLPQGNGQNPYR